MSKLSRRNLLKASAAAVAFGTLPDWSKVHAQALDESNLKNLIIFYAQGGWDATACLDPKQGLSTVDSPAGNLKMFGDMNILVGDERPNVDAFYTEYGSIASVVRGIEVRSIAHEECTKRIFTGTNDASNPDVGSIVGHLSGDDLPVPYMVFGNTSYVGPYTKTSGRIGSTGQLSTLLSPSRAYPWQTSTRFTPTETETNAIQAFLGSVTERDLKTRGAAPITRAKIEGLNQSSVRSEKLRALVDSFGEQRFALELEPQIDLAVRALKDGISRSVLIQDPGQWDTHAQSDPQQFMALNNMYGGLMELVRRLDTEGILDNTIIAVVSEMSRTPKLNDAQGKDHWPVTSALVLGADIKGGSVVGATTDMVESVAINPATGAIDENGDRPNGKSFAAGLLQAVGANPASHFADTTPITAFIDS